MHRRRFPADALDGLVYTSRPGDMRPLLLRSGLVLVIYLDEAAARAEDRSRRADIRQLDGTTIPNSAVPVISGALQPFLGPANGTTTLYAKPPGGVVQPVHAQPVDPGLTPMLALAPLTAGQVVHVSATSSDIGVAPASSDRPGTAETAVGLAASSAAAGTAVDVRSSGPLDLTSPWPAGTRLYLGRDGFPTPDPNSGRVQLHVAVALGPTALQVRLLMPLHR